MITNSRLYHLLLLAAFSLLAAGICFYLGGYIAEATSATPIMGITFKATGALAGFLITFIVLFTAYLKLGVNVPPLKITVWPPKGNFPHTGDPYSVTVAIIKYGSGKQQPHNAIVVWEMAGLTVHLREIEENDMVLITLTDCHGTSWSSVFFNPLYSDQKLN